MTTIPADPPRADLPPEPHTPPASKPTSLRRVAAASSIGTTIEFYDFFIYGTAAALVFPTVFFPAADEVTGTIASFATFAVAFFARPVGAMLFGHFGDRIGRKRTLVWTLLIMGLATVAMGLLPGYESGVFGFAESGIGIGAPIALVVLRFLQGFAVGGEWAGATLLTAEYAPAGKRGLYAMFPQLGPAFAFFLSSLTFLIASLTLGETSSAFLDYGWRIPFILSFALVAVGLWVRLAVAETPVFRDVQRRKALEAAASDGPASNEPALPFLDAFRHQWKEILIAGGALASLFSLFYMGTAFLTNYGTKSLDLSRTFVLSAGMIAAIVFGLSTAASAMWSDRVGRRRVILTSCAIAVPWALVLFPILEIGGGFAFVIGLTGTLLIFGIAYGPAGALLPELFEARYRYTGAGMGYNLAGIFGGAIPPLIAAPLIAGPGAIWVGVLLAGLSAISVVCTILIVETKDKAMRAATESPEEEPSLVG
ncbi:MULTISPECIES: MFS transporter [Gordonia]|uniref:MFS transporter n=1 Tax=Gordonia amicalis TaxID=89053 RepID=A0AAE4U869_9ACTN|nr:MULTISPECIES: MFS transporter [Gordonia]KAF0968903.1 Inner membrane metabolite transport protein YhjE [Gordonia sp. YY1]MCZ4579481.1 MFS transporter [Gordonia amicalis]MDJ0452072.1 MFS transporter [Gordonia amicalis]MDV6308142.1 MFS transporter [Gordonia amicalis]MDV6312046.1 MFS transporter [Gordonia amicalis]